jgi:phage tail-like protein
MLYQLELKSPEGDQQRILLPELTTIGRQQGNDLVLDDERISRRHAVIECHDDLCWITDLGSSNGTLLGEERLPPNASTPIPPGMEIRVGGWQLVLSFLQSDEVEPPPIGEAGPSPDAAPVDAGAPEEETSPEEPPAPVSPPPPGEGVPPTEDGFFPPGLGHHSRSLLAYLPGIYHTEFMSRFLALFESILTPIEWNIDNFDLFLDPGTAPGSFLTWLAEWFDTTFDPTWSEVQRRQLLREAHTIYARRGTRWALSRVLEVYTGATPTIIDADATLEPFTFKVILPTSAALLGRDAIEGLIDAHKPTHTMYTLEFS